MDWIVMGGVILIVLLLFLGLFFRSSGAFNIAREEREEIEKEPPEELEKQVQEVEEENIEVAKTVEDEFHSARG